MLKCEICNTEPQTSLLTRCCKLFICDSCRERYEKTVSCICGKPINKKLCTNSPQLFEIVKNYYEGRPQQCDRCEQAAEVECLDCNMVYCEECNADVHNGKGFAKHCRQTLVRQGKSHKKIVQKMRNKDELCNEHKQVYELVCECGQFLCGGCVKNHKDGCLKPGSKTKPIKEYKEEYFSQILYKIKKITEYKEKLQDDKKEYGEHFKKQKETFETYSKLMDEQLEGIRKILDMKITEIKSRLSDYWRQCTEFHRKNQYIIEYHHKKFDDLARISQKFVQKMTGYQYLEKRVKRININQQFFNFKLQGVEQVQFSILNMSCLFKNWQQNPQDNILLNLEPNDEKLQKQKRGEQQNMSHPSANSQLLLQCSQNPYTNRPLALKSSHNQIMFQFLHLPYQNDAYEIEYGVGLKMKGQEIFKKIENRNGVGIINTLNPSTKYRVRMRVVGGQWGPITQIKTQQSPKIVTDMTSVSKHMQEAPLQILKTGTVYGSNEISFGTHSWQIKIFPPKNNDEQTACVSVGVSNKQQKKPVFVGTTLNYGYQKAMLTVKITLNCDENRMIISHSSGGQDEIYQNLPNFPIYPAIQNKGSHPVQIQCLFN